MLAIKKNNTLVPLTSDARIGNPLGTIIAIYTTRVPAGYLPCNGATFDQTQYPALYALLGTNVLPDLREATLKGIGLNSNATEHVSADGLVVGEYLDDRVQAHAHDIFALTSNTVLNYRVIDYSTAGTATGALQARGTSARNYGARDIYSGRNGATTEVKSVGVNYVIKAVPGIEESQADYVTGIIEDYVDAIQDIDFSSYVGTTFTVDTTHGAHAYKNGKVVQLCFKGTFTGSLAVGGGAVLFSGLTNVVPVPKWSHYLINSAYCKQTAGYVPCNLVFNPTGVIVIHNTSSGAIVSGDLIEGQITYICE